MNLNCTINLSQITHIQYGETSHRYFPQSRKINSKAARENEVSLPSCVLGLTINGIYGKPSVSNCLLSCPVSMGDWVDDCTFLCGVKIPMATLSFTDDEKLPHK